MFLHNLKYSLKTLLRSRALIFWTFAFPIILGTFFNMAFSNITDSTKLDIIDIAIVENDDFNNNAIYKESFKRLSDKRSKDRLFDIVYTTEKKAKDLLEKDKIVGYLEFNEDDYKLVFSNSGINQTIFKYVTEEVVQSNIMIKRLSEEEIKKQIALGNYAIDYEKLYQNVATMVVESNTHVKNVSNNNLDFAMIEFYTLIAMTCLYGGIISMVAIGQNLPNMTNIGKRVSISPTRKSVTIMSSVLASYIIQVAGLFILFMYLIFILHIDFGDNVLLVALLAAVGSLAGLAMGVAVSTLFKSSENTKVGILLGYTMLGCFLSGMMGITLKYYIDKFVPIVNKINPASMITDGFYALYYYNTFDRYWIDVISLCIFAFILLLLSVFSLRRQKYDSI